MNASTQDFDPSRDVALTLGREQLVIHRRYQTASIFNDFMIAIWFLLGSVFFLYPSLMHIGTWLFILGSAQFLIRPMIRLAHHVYVRRLPHGGWEM